MIKYKTKAKRKQNPTHFPLSNRASNELKARNTKKERLKSMLGGDSNKPRTIKLFCPSVAKLVPLVVWDCQKLDLGSVARAFGLDPSTVKLNGHFVSRGKDLVSSSVTWRSLLSFFSSKGLSTGTDDDKGALIVDGKLCKVGSKRAHESLQDGVNGNQQIAGKPGLKDARINAKVQQLNDLDSMQSKKMRNSSSDEGFSGVRQVSKWSNHSCKRESLMEDVSLLKRLKINEPNSDFQGRGNNNSSTVTSAPSKCSFMSGNMKRMREDEVIGGTSGKRMSSYGCHAG